jgi:ABC-2 type transport system ATP-binding protein
MEPIIKIRNLNKWYWNAQVLKDIDFDIYPGQVIGYIGPNGAGKSTTVKILTGLITDYTGSIFIKGMDLAQNGLEIKRIMGYVPETAELYDVLTPMEYLRFVADLYSLPQDSSEAKIKKLITSFGLFDVLDQRMDSFSKGMKQKVLIISALLHNPEIIILDEPLSGLDANSVILIKELVTKLSRLGKTIFYCSHIMDIVEKVSDRIILIDKGKVIANGSFAELKIQSGNESLEKIFTGFTQPNTTNNTADQIVDTITN